MVQSHEGGIGTVEECKLKPGLGAQIGETIWFFGLCYASIWRFLSIVFDLERTNQLNLLPDKDLVDLCPPIEPYQVRKNRRINFKV